MAALLSVGLPIRDNGVYAPSTWACPHPTRCRGRALSSVCARQLNRSVTASTARALSLQGHFSEPVYNKPYPQPEGDLMRRFVSSRPLCPGHSRSAASRCLYYFG